MQKLLSSYYIVWRVTAENWADILHMYMFVQFISACLSGLLETIQSNGVPKMVCSVSNWQVIPKRYNSSDPWHLPLLKNMCLLLGVLNNMWNSLEYFSKTLISINLLFLLHLITLCIHKVLVYRLTYVTV